MKIICHTDDNIDSSVIIGRAIKWVVDNKPKGMGGIVYGDDEYEMSWIENKSSYSVWVRKSK